MRHTKGTLSVRKKKLTALFLSAAVAFSVPVMHAFADVQEAENFQEVMVESDAGAERPAQEQNADETAENTEIGNEETADDANADEAVSQDDDETDTASGAAQGTDSSADGSSEEPDAEEPAAVVASVGQHTYSSLREAVAAAQAGDKVCLHQDAAESVMIKKDMTLDLQGHSVTGSTSYAICVNGATAVIVNGALKDTKMCIRDRVCYTKLVKRR